MELIRLEGSLGVGKEQGPVETGLGDLAVRHRRFLGDQMTQHGASLTCDEVEDPMVNSPMGDPELVDTIAKVLRLRASQLTPALGESGDANRSGLPAPIS